RARGARAGVRRARAGDSRALQDALTNCCVAVFAAKNLAGLAHANKRCDSGGDEVPREAPFACRHWFPLAIHATQRREITAESWDSPRLAACLHEGVTRDTCPMEDAVEQVITILKQTLDSMGAFFAHTGPKLLAASIVVVVGILLARVVKAG